MRHAHTVAHEEMPEELASDTAPPDEQLMTRERSRRLVEAVRRLELPYRQVITLLLEDMSYTDIAEALGLTLTNVGVRVNRAKTRLKELLRHE
jgi:RNA polymerase sigma-70 factor, ECF subfamily